MTDKGYSKQENILRDELVSILWEYTKHLAMISSNYIKRDISKGDAAIYADHIMEVLKNYDR